MDVASQAAPTAQMQDCDEIPTDTLSWTNGNAKAVTLDKFFPQGATLTQVELTWSTRVTHTVTITNTSEVTGDITVDFIDHLRVALPNGGEIDNVITPPTFFFEDVPPMGTGGPDTKEESEVGVLIYPLPFTDFIAGFLGETITLPVTGTAQASVLAPGTFDLSANSRASAELCITYTFTAPLAKVGNFVWNDLNRNGIQDLGESGLGGITVTLYSCNGPAIASKQMQTASTNLKSSRRGVIKLDLHCRRTMRFRRPTKAGMTRKIATWIPIQTRRSVFRCRRPQKILRAMRACISWCHRAS